LRAEWALSLNLLREYVVKLSESLRLSIGNGPLERYIHILFACLCAAYGRVEFCEPISSNPLLEDPVRVGRAFIEAMGRLSERGPTISGGSILYAIERAESILKNREKKPFIVLCDGLSLPEYTYLYDRFSRVTHPSGLLYAINPGGMTKTYEYLTSILLNLPAENMTMTVVGELLRRRLEAVGSMVLREVDELVHRAQTEKFPTTSDMAISLHKVIEEIAFKIGVLSEDYCVLVLSDHGYDVFLEVNGWSLSHAFSNERPCLSLFSAMLIIG
jgi:hypothetical protein